MPKSKETYNSSPSIDDILKEQFPNIDRFLNERGWIEIGENDMTSALVRAYDEGGTIYEGKTSYPTWHQAFQDLDQGIAAFIEKNGG